MRPVSRGSSPVPGPYDPYEKAKSHLIGRLGSYCSYCERRVEANLAVEHVQPKNLPSYAHLENEWTNFLLGCVNCNSTKSKKDVVFADILMPDRDNTFNAYEYSVDGKVAVKAGLRSPNRDKAEALLALVGLDRTITTVFDENGKQIVIDRASKRMEIFATAKRAATRITANPGNNDLVDMAIDLAVESGGFSIWMQVFSHNVEMKRRLIDAFPGTRASGCFDPLTQAVISPHPNLDLLMPGGHI